MSALPKIALTTGDPAGIGPEIAAKAAADAAVRAVCEPVIFESEVDASVRPGEVSAAAGLSAYNTIVRAIEAARAARSTRSPRRPSTSSLSRRRDCRGRATRICSRIYAATCLSR